MRVLGWIAAALALAGGSSAQAAESACISPADAEALATVLLPDALEAVGKRCEASLPATATLRAGLAPLAARWRSEGTGRTAAAAVAAGKLVGGDTKGADPNVVLGMMRAVLVGQLAQSVKPEACASVDRAVTLVAPLPAANIAGVAIMLAQLEGAGKKAEELPICKAPRP